MFKKFLLFLFALCFLPLALRAQTVTVVSGQVQDPQGLVFAAGTVTATLVPTAGGASPTITATGAPATNVQTVSMDLTGSFSMGLVANGSITPASSTYSFLVCSFFQQPPLGSTQQSCFTVTGVTVSGATQDLSATLTNASVREIKLWDPTRVFNTPSAATTSSISATTMYTAPAHPVTGTQYTFSPYVTLTTVGASCGGNSTVVVSAIFQDPNAASAQTEAIGTYTITSNGTLGIVPLTSNIYSGKITLVAKAGTVVQYSTTYTPNGACSPNPTYQVFPVLQLN